MGYAVLKSIHLLGVIVWLGGMFFALWCLRPAVAALDPAARVTVMREALGRFLNAVVVAALLVLVTGAWLIATASRGSVKAGIGFNMPLDWHVMVTLGVLMMVIFGYVRFALYPRLQERAEARNWAGAGEVLARIRRLVALNLGLGVVIVVVTRLGAVA